MNARTRLSQYAQSHMVLINIDRRFETVIARHPKRDTPNMRWRIQHARMQGLHERNEFPFLLDRFDWALR